MHLIVVLLAFYKNEDCPLVGIVGHYLTKRHFEYSVCRQYLVAVKVILVHTMRNIAVYETNFPYNTWLVPFEVLV